MDKDGNGFVDQKEFCEAIENFKLPDLYARNPEPSSLLLSSLELNDTKVYEPSVRALLGTASHFCAGGVLK